ncbi:hypothetical protein EDC62_0207 [Tibeticola sediminis]|uniref:Uncharacterized protein n=1 Tax=Tibeticola sediminis TaxID=1917811 RepID=A0A3N4UPE5_9BURK|nr:hypothetical protein [Tibeticola sediminis]RPE72516.1 hypothetical protein EDC62_0207 [Tibeticola sediminis]
MAGRAVSGVCQDVEGLYRAGASIKEIMRLTGLSRSSVKYHIYIKEPQKEKKKAERRCMCCGTRFASEGPHNRMCCMCRKKDDYMLFAA